MIAGRELDALVASKVMGLNPELEYGFKWTENGVERESWGNSPQFTIDKCNHYRSIGFNAELISKHTAEPYSTDIAAAWEVLERLCPPDNNECFFNLFYRAGSADWVCEFNSSGAVNAPTAPHAISLAALKACGVEL